MEEKNTKDKRLMFFIFCIPVMFVIAVLMKFFVIGEPLNLDTLYFDMAINDDNTYGILNIHSTESGIVHTKWTCELKNNILYINAKRVLPSIWNNSAVKKFKVDLKKTNKIVVMGKQVWPDIKNMAI